MKITNKKNSVNTQISCACVRIKLLRRRCLCDCVVRESYNKCQFDKISSRKKFTRGQKHVRHMCSSAGIQFQEYTLIFQVKIKTGKNCERKNARLYGEQTKTRIDCEYCCRKRRETENKKI